MKRKPTPEEVKRTLDYFLSINAITMNQYTHLSLYVPQDKR